MQAFVGFLWSERSDFSAWSWNLNKQKLIEWVQSEYLTQSTNGINNICVSKLFNNLSDVKARWRLATGNEWNAIENFLVWAENSPSELKEYFIDNQPHDK